MIRVTLGEILHADNIGVLKKLFTSNEVSPGFKWENRKLFSEINEEIQSFGRIESQARKKYTSTEKNDEGKKVEVLDKENYWDEIAPILEEEIELDYEPLDEEELKKLDFNIEEILAIEFLLE